LLLLQTALLVPVVMREPSPALSCAPCPHSRSMILRRPVQRWRRWAESKATRAKSLPPTLLLARFRSSFVQRSGRV
ncbi:hypothetical protein FRC12_013832, partial [Ceratobasidium sp. 428]